VNDAIIIGGGLAGLFNAILLNRAGLRVKLFEEKAYPFHRVCGEYISNEVTPFLEETGLFPYELNPSQITKFQLSDCKGKSLKMKLDLGGFGLSRYAFDHWLAQKATAEGVSIHQTRIVNLNDKGDYFQLKDKEDNTWESKIVIGAFGKRSILDKALNRPFTTKRSPYVGVKYHIRTNEVPPDLIALHNFPNGYCGVSRIENDMYNLCYLTHQKNLRETKSVEVMEEVILKKNPYLHEVFLNSEILFDKPEVISEITFEQKEPVYNHVFMSGDAAGMITPLCGNGMAMAIHSAKLLSEILIKNLNGSFDRVRAEEEYRQVWNQHFAKRLWTGRKIQRLFGHPLLSTAAVGLGKNIPVFANYLMRQTHGTPF
jgi:flavin-dependent dehydrogenase